jgi:hypothetical protein
VRRQEPVQLSQWGEPLWRNTTPEGRVHRCGGCDDPVAVASYQQVTVGKQRSGHVPHDDSQLTLAYRLDGNHCMVD